MAWTQESGQIGRLAGLGAFADLFGYSRYGLVAFSADRGFVAHAPSLKRPRRYENVLSRRLVSTVSKAGYRLGYFCGKVSYRLYFQFMRIPGGDQLLFCIPATASIKRCVMVRKRCSGLFAIFAIVA